MKRATLLLMPTKPAKRANVADDFAAACNAETAGDLDTARELFEAIIAQDDAFAPAYLNLGSLLFNAHRYSRAEELYRRATEIDPSYALAFFNLGSALDELDRLDESIAAYERAIALAHPSMPAHFNSHYNLALTYMRAGNHCGAHRHFRAYAKLDRSGPWHDHAWAQIRAIIFSSGLELTPKPISKRKGSKRK